MEIDWRLYIYIYMWCMWHWLNQAINYYLLNLFLYPHFLLPFLLDCPYWVTLSSSLVLPLIIRDPHHSVNQFLFWPDHHWFYEYYENVVNLVDISWRKGVTGFLDCDVCSCREVKNHWMMQWDHPHGFKNWPSRSQLYRAHSPLTN